MAEHYLDFGEALNIEYGKFYREPDLSMVHLHPHYELAFFLKPQRVLSIVNQAENYIDYPHVLLVAPFIPHFCYPMEYSGYYERCILYFGSTLFSSSRFTGNPTELLHGGTACVFNVTGQSHIYQNLLSLLWELKIPAEREKVLDLLLYLLKKNQKPLTILQNMSEPYIKDVISYINENLSEKSTIQDLSERFAVSPDKLRKDFLKTTYLTIGRFIQLMKLNKAKALLGKSGTTVSDIVEQCGYESESYFYRLFKKETGKTPNEYKKNRT